METKQNKFDRISDNKIEKIGDMIITMSDEKKVLNVPLPSGGHLKVNVDNFGDIGRAAGMFSPADLNAIMRAIAQYNHCTSKLNEIEDEEDEAVEEATENNNDKSFGSTMGNVTEMASPNLTLHISKEGDAEKSIGSWANANTGQSITVYQPEDYDPANPVFKMKIWDKDDNLIEER